MRSVACCLLIFLVAPIASTQASHDAPATLGSIRQTYLNQKVVVGGPVATVGGQDFLLDWSIPLNSGDRFEMAVGDPHLPSTYLGKTAKVIVVQADDAGGGASQTNALGEKNSEDSIVDPYFDLVVEFDDGKLAMATDYPSGLPGFVELASRREEDAKEITGKLPNVIGKIVYAAGFSNLYRPTATLAELDGTCDINSNCGLKAARDKLAPIVDFPLLRPFRIMAAKYIASENGVVLKIRMPDGREALSFTSQQYITDPKLRNKPFLNWITGSLLSAIPHDFTAREVDAVQQGNLFRGMRKHALEYLLGAADKENNWGAAGKQLIYDHGRTFVYLDSKNKVVDWQFLEK